MSFEENTEWIQDNYMVGSRSSKKFKELDEYYILWSGSHFVHSNGLINFNFDRLIKNDPKFQGFLCNTLTEDSLGRFGAFRTISPLEFARRRRRGESIGLVSFCSTPSELRIFESLKIDTFSFVCVMHAKNVNHTYVSIEEERVFILENAKRFQYILSNFTDNTSKRMLISRMRSILSLDMDHIIRNYYDVSLEYFNPFSPEYSFVLNDAEILCDVGASWGDCVIKFAEMVPNIGKSYVYAFEPNGDEFKKLRTLEHFFPLKADNAIVSNSAGAGYFQTDSVNLHGSHLSASGTQADQRRTVRLDDACEKATLIKIDAEGGEPDILAGAVRLLANPDCRLASCMYHYPGDLFKTIDLMESLGRKNFFFRQHHPSLWDGILYFH